MKIYVVVDYTGRQIHGAYKSSNAAAKKANSLDDEENDYIDAEVEHVILK